MGVMNVFRKSTSDLLHLPHGSLTIDRRGIVISRTLTSQFPEDLVRDLAQRVLAAFREANEAQVPLSQLTIDYPSLKITAREMRGGAIVFLTPKNSAAIT